MSDAIIIAENIGKRYVLNHQASGGGSYKRFSEVIVDSAKRLFSASSHAATPATTEDFWALKDVSFEIKRGECVGIIGRNGAGKSTLLKILSRITEPTTGRITLKGRVASLLEVGTGFHPELTGRENIYLNGAILGMARAEIKAKFDEIVAFAEIEKFLDTPVKRYSSGMYVRLAFAVAAHLEPEILIVDEVLAVGDAQFQKKCMGKMQDVAQGGRTVLFVSHNLGAIRQLTKRCLVLASAKVAFDGTPELAIEEYISVLPQKVGGRYDATILPRFIPGTGTARFVSLSFTEDPAVFATGKPIVVQAEVSFASAIRNTRFSITVRTPESEAICTGFGPADIECNDHGLRFFTIPLPIEALVPGHYHCTVALSTPVGNTEMILDALTEVLHFELFPGENAHHEPSPWNSNWGNVRMPLLEVKVST